MTDFTFEDEKEANSGSVRPFRAKEQGAGLRGTLQSFDAMQSTGRACCLPV